MTFKEARDVYWKYYVSLEDQLMETSRYVEFDYINNGKTYSIEYLKLFQAVCSEIDVIGKSLAALLDASFTPTKHTGINEWWFFITSYDADIISKNCNLFGEHVLRPWENYVVIRNSNRKGKKYILDEDRSPKAKTPTWWNDYNSVKHNRTGLIENNRDLTNYVKANLKNLFYAFAALYSLEVELMQTAENQENKKLPENLESRLFKEELSFYTYNLVLEP